MKTKRTFLFAAVAVLLFSSPAYAKKIYKNEPHLPPPVPSRVIHPLAQGNINGAILTIREEKLAPKLMYLLHAAEMIDKFMLGHKPRKEDAHKAYQNVAIAYHNLYLFLKSYGIEQKDYLKNAHRYYRRAAKNGTIHHKADCDLLRAALAASAGDQKKAQKEFLKIDESIMRGDFESSEYLAAYYAATGEVPKAVAALESAYHLNKEALLTWLTVGDDFHAISDDESFKTFLTSLKAKDTTEKIALSRPKAVKPRLEVTDETGLFRPQKDMPHYDLKKDKRPRKAKETAKNGSSSKKKVSKTKSKK